MIIYEDGRVANAARTQPPPLCLGPATTCKKRLKRWETVFFFIQSFIASLILLNASDQGLQEKMVDTYNFEALKASIRNYTVGDMHQFAL